jgi:hypothetical protein
MGKNLLVYLKSCLHPAKGLIFLSSFFIVPVLFAENTNGFPPVSHFKHTFTPSTTVLASDINPSCLNTNITLTATVSPAIATGSVEFFDGVVSLGIATLSGGIASISLSSLTAGSHTLTAVYSGDIDYETSTSPALTQLINAAIPSTPGTISGISSQCPSLIEQIYSISPVSGANGYNWSVPAGWSITGGAGTETISVTTGTTGQGGTVTVTAFNACGTGASNSLAVTVGNGAPSTPGIITGTTPVCPGITTLTYSIGAVANATTYTWTVPAGWSITAGAGTISITVTSGTGGGDITVIAANDCGNSAPQIKPVVVNPGIPATPGTITGTATVCPGITGLVYSIAAVPNATSYTWSFPGGWSITSGSNTISPTVTSGANSGNITVAAVNSCGSSSASQTISITPVNAANNTGYTDNTTKSSDGIVTGTTVPERRGYLKFPLSAIPAGVTISASNLKITNNNSLSSSGAASYVKGLGAVDPVTASAAVIFTAAGAGGAGIVYNTAIWGITGQLSLNLLAQANTDITNSITTPGYISMGLVRASANMYNFYGYSGGANAPILTVTYASIRSFAVTVNPATPVTPGAISGSTTVCPATTGYVYSIAAVTNATSYTWNVPAGWTITSGQGTLSITATSGAVGGNISVTASNSCGTSAARTQAVTISAIPTVSATPLTQNTCSGLAIGTISITNPNGIPGTTFNWSRDNTILVTGIAASGTSSSITGSLTNLFPSAQTVNFSITASANGCTSAPVTSTVIVNPNPVANAGIDQQICTASNTTIGGFPAATGGTPGYTYSWTAGVSNTAIANPTAPSGTYTLTVTDSKGCIGTDAIVVTNGSSTKTWIGGGTNGSGPDNNFNNPLNWSPAGVPASCNDVIINVDVTSITDFFSGSLVISQTADATINSLNLRIGGTVIFSATTNFRLDVGTRKLTILNNTLINTDASTFIAIPARSYISVGAGGVLTFGGALTSTVSNGCTNFPIYASTNNTGKVYMNGNATLAGLGPNLGNCPGQVIFNGTGTQSILQNTSGQTLFLGATSTDVGETNAPTVVLGGSSAGGFKNIGDLNVNTNATLDLAQQIFNRNTSGGSINLAAGSFLKVGHNTGGVGTSNFPTNYTTYAFNATSTVDFNASTAQTVIQSPLYGNIAFSNSNTKTASGALTAQRNITISGSAVFVAGTVLHTLGGNWTSWGQGGLNEQTSIIDFNGNGPQSINTAGGEIFYRLNKSGTGTLTQLCDVSVQGGGTSSFTLSNGTYDAGTFSFNSAASAFNISNGLLKLARLNTTLPEFAIAGYNITGGTIELNGAGNQVLRGARAYRNLTFSNSGTKTLTSATSSVTGTILTQDAVVLDVSNNTFGGAGTNLTMTGTSLYRTAGTGTKPDAQEIYTLGAGTAIEFTNSLVTTQDIRLTAPTYYNIIVSGTSVANPSAGTGIKMQSGGTFTVKNGAKFLLGNNAGFSGSLTASVSNTNNPSIVLEDGSVIEYYGGPLGTNPQSITNQVPYSGLNFSGTSIKTAPAGTVTVKGNFSNTNSGFAHNNGTFLFNGTIAQNYNTTGTPFSFYNLTVTNPVNLNLNGDLNIIKLLSLSTTGKLNLLTGNISLKSDVTGTASVDKINVNNSITYGGTGRFIVERFIPTGLSHGKSWQFLSAPAFGQTVNAAWQEGNAPLVTGTAGLGTTISSEKAGAVSRGYDFYTPAGPSIKTYNAASNNWEGIDDGVTPTGSMLLNSKKGYMLFVRGDRSVQASATPANEVTLRTGGKLYSPGTDAPPTSTVLLNSLGSVGNPYASSIDFTSLVSSSAGIDNKYYVWDPLLPGSNGFGLGGYQLLSSANLWMPVPGGTVNYPTGVPYTKIQSGQAFFVYSTPGGSVNFTENNKIAGSQQVFRQQAMSDTRFLRSWLYGQSGNLADGNVVAFDESFENGFDAEDAIKVENTGENFGIVANDKKLALDARGPVTPADTIQYSFSGLRMQPYLLKLAPTNMDMHGPAAFFVDRFNRTETPVSLTDSTFIAFSITNDPASADPKRFFIVFRSLQPVPVTIVSVTATRVRKAVLVQWKVENELNIERYELEKSADGRLFAKTGSTSPVMNNGSSSIYQYNDEHPFDADNFYRIKAIGFDGRIQYSSIVKVAAIIKSEGISIYPNPIVGKVIHLYFNGQEAGEYAIRIANQLGEIIHRGVLSVNGTRASGTIKLGYEISKGNYQLLIVGPGGRQFTQQVSIE